MGQKNRELEAEAATETAASKKKEAGEYDLVVRQLQFEMKAKVCCVIVVFFCVQFTILIHRNVY